MSEQTVYHDMMDAEYCVGALMGGRATATEQQAAARHLSRLLDASCDHAGYQFKLHGRCCPKCSKVLTDFGD